MAGAGRGTAIGAKTMIFIKGGGPPSASGNAQNTGFFYIYDRRKMANLMQGPDDGSWRTPSFRQNMVNRIEDAVTQCGAPTTKNAAEMETQVYTKATTKNEYLSFVARLIMHIKEMGNKNKAQQGGPGGQQMMGQGQPPNPHQQMMSPMNPIGMNQGQMQQQPPQMQQGGMGMQQPGMMGQPQMRMMGQPMMQQQGQQMSFPQQSQVQNVNVQQVPMPPNMMGQHQGVEQGGGVPGAGRGVRMPGPGIPGMQPMPRKTLRAMPPGVDGASGMQFQGNAPQGGMQRPGGPFLPPNAGPGMQMAPNQSPNTLNVQGSQPGFVNSPQPSHPHGSPAPPSSGPIRPFGTQMIPSPSTMVNTPMPALAPAPSPGSRSAEEVACMKKIEELRRYTDMIQRMIVKIGNEDAEKSTKMKKLLDILMNPNRQVSMDILLKCEVALKKMEKQQHETIGPPSQPTMPPKDQVSPFLQIQEAIVTALKNGSASHTFLRTFRPSVEALTGQSAAGPEGLDDVIYEEDEEPEQDLSPILQRELKLMGRRFPVKMLTRGKKLPIQLSVSLGDTMLPRVPPLKVAVPVEYPEESPVMLDFKHDYGSTPFLTSIFQAFVSRKTSLPTKFTLYELLVAWELSVRQVSDPICKKKHLKRLGVSQPSGIVSRVSAAFV